MAIRLSYFAFYQELGFQVGRTVSAAEMRRELHQDKANIVTYLRAGSPLVVVPGYADDPIDEAGSPILGGGSVLTDGEWAWPQIAATLVDKHDLAVPDQFVRHMSKSGYVPRAISADEAREIFAQAGEALSVLPSEETPQQSATPQLVILDVRSRNENIAECVARAERESITEGQQLWDIRGENNAVGPTSVESIQLRGDSVPVLGRGQTARVMLTGTHVADLKFGTILTAVELR